MRQLMASIILRKKEVEKGTLPAKAIEKTALSGKRKADDEAPENSMNNQSGGNSTGRSYSYQSQSKRSGNNSGNNRQGGSGQSNYKGNLSMCNKCGRHHAGGCRKNLSCERCGKKSHEAKDCWTILPEKQNRLRQNNNNNHGNNNYGNNRNGQGNNQNNNGGARGCFECGAQGHIKRDCPQLRRQGNGNQGNNGGDGNGGENGNGNGNNGNGGNGRGRAFVMGQGEARNDANVINDR